MLPRRRLSHFATRDPVAGYPTFADGIGLLIVSLRATFMLKAPAKGAISS